MDKDKFNNAINAFAASFKVQNHLPTLRAHLEEEYADRPYQLMAVYQRNRHKGVKGEYWPDKPEGGFTHPP